MSRLIDCEKIRKPIYAEDDNITGIGMTYGEIEVYNAAIDEFWNRIKSAPTVDAVPVVHGHWIILRYPSGAKYSVCSECQTYMVDYSERNSMRKINAEGAKYCPNCGARMDGETEEDES